MGDKTYRVGMVVIHLLKEDGFRKLIRELYPKSKISYYTMNIPGVVKRVTIMIDSNDVEPIENIDTFLKMKYPNYNGYTVQPSTYNPAEDYTYINKELDTGSLGITLIVRED